MFQFESYNNGSIRRLYNRKIILFSRRRMHLYHRGNRNGSGDHSK